ncbi:MAG: hypothetical protein U1F47_07115 [Hyphomicrobiales bacterium]
MAPDVAAASENDDLIFSADDCRGQLARILRSPDFQTPERGRRFLSYIVEETLAGRAERIKAYSVATQVFGRGTSFDPKADPIVRIEAGQLRKALDRYYLGAGRFDPILISIPKGHYVPRFSKLARQVEDTTDAISSRSTTSRRLGTANSRMWFAALLMVLAIGGISTLTLKTREVESRHTPAIPRLLVVPFENLSGPSGAPVTSGLDHEIVTQLAKFRDLVVLQRDSADTLQKETEVSPSLAPRFLLTGTTDVSDSIMRVQAQLTDRIEGTVIWANSFDGDLRVSKLMQIEDEIARQVATTIAQPYGIIFQADANRRVERAPEDWAAYACTLSYFKYRASLDPKTHPAVRKCLEETVKDFPTYSTAWALLSQTYIDELRFQFPPDPSSSPASLERATSAARRALELDPNSVRAQQAMMFALFFNGQVDTALKVGAQALATNPNDTELMGEYGYRLALSGKWTEGAALLEEARLRNPGPLAYYETALGLCRYFEGDYKTAAEWVTKTTAPQNPNFHLIAAAVLAESGDTERAAQERDWVLKNTPAIASNLRSFIERRFGRKEDAEKFIGSLRKAGFQVP